MKFMSVNIENFEPYSPVFEIFEEKPRIIYQDSKDLNDAKSYEDLKKENEKLREMIGCKRASTTAQSETIESATKRQKISDVQYKNEEESEEIEMSEIEANLD